MSANIENHLGGVFISRNGTKRLSRTSVTVRGVSMDVEYLTFGSFLAATETDPTETPTVDVKVVEIHGEEIQHILSDEMLSSIATAIESEWR